MAQELLEIKGESDITTGPEDQRNDIETLETTRKGIETRGIEKKEDDLQEREGQTRELDGPVEPGLDRTGTGWSEYSEAGKYWRLVLFPMVS